MNEHEELRECYELVLKMARRVTRDLRHALDAVPDTHPMKEMMNQRYLDFKTIFDDVADYRSKIHLELQRIEVALRVCQSKLPKEQR